MEFVYAFLFGVLDPLAAALISWAWLILIVRFGLLPLMLEQSQLPTERKRRTARNVTRLILGISVIGVSILPFVCSNPDSLRNLGTTLIAEESFTLIFGFLYGPVWLALVVEGWLVLLCYFGLRYLLNLLNIPVDQHQQISGHATIVTLIIGILTGLVGFGWWIVMGNAHWSRLAEASRFGLVVLSPTLVLLTAGMVVMLPISLIKALSAEEDNVESERARRSMTITLVSVLMLLGVVGGIWSAFLYRAYW